MTREEAYYILRVSRDEIQSKGHTEFDMLDLPCLDMAIAALREQEERSKACPYCDIAKANEGVRNTVLWVKEPETNKWTMMGKKLLFCPKCGRRLEEV